MISVAKGKNFSISFAYGGHLVRTRRTDTETICRKSINLFSIHFSSIASQHIERIRPPSILAWNRRFLGKVFDSGPESTISGRPIPICFNNFTTCIIFFRTKPDNVSARGVDLTRREKKKCPEGAQNPSILGWNRRFFPKSSIPARMDMQKVERKWSKRHIRSV